MSGVMQGILTTLYRSSGSCPHLKQEGGLGDIADLAAQLLQGQGADVPASQADRPSADLRQPQQSGHQAAFAGAWSTAALVALSASDGRA